MILTHDQLKQAIHNWHEASHWILLDEVRDASGFEGRRSIDVIAFGLYASRDYELHAFECKASRTDWLKELAQPDKADAFATIADKFWIVANKEVVEIEELPPSWGLLLVSSSGEDKFRIRTAKQAIASIPQNLPRPFVASMLTRYRKQLEGMIPESSITTRLKAEFKRGKEVGSYKAGGANQMLKDLQRELKAFEAVSGIKIDYYTEGADLGKKVAFLEYLRKQEKWGGFLHATKRMADSLTEIANSVKKQVEDLEEARKELVDD